VLIVEDEAITALGLELTVRSLGYEVCGIVASGEDAVAAAGDHRPDLVLMDVRLSGEMDGIAAAAAIRREYGIPSLLVTAFSDPQTYERARECRSVGLLAKPYTASQVERTLADVAAGLGQGEPAQARSRMA